MVSAGRTVFSMEGMPGGDVAESQRVLTQIARLADADDPLDAGYARLAETYTGEEARAERAAARQRYVAGTSGDGPGAGSPQH